MKFLSLYVLIIFAVQNICYATEKKHEVVGVPASKALTWLENGNGRYMQNHLRKDGQDRKARMSLIEGQKPHAIVISCSDSRIPPEIVFDQKLGEIFVVRNAGEALDSSSIASVEYAVEHLGISLILVLGHESCGAVKAAVKTLDGSSAGSVNLDKLVADIHPRIRELLKLKKTTSNGFMAEALVNAKGITEDLKARSEIIKKKVEANELEIHYALYYLSTGKVDFY